MANMIEVKHEVVQVFSMKTRGVFTLVKGVNPSIANQVLAKSGVSPPPDCNDHNQFMVELCLDRQPRQKTMTRPFISVRNQYIKCIDVFRLVRETSLNLEYDFKRRPINPRMVSVGEGKVGHLAFDTVPWDTVEEAELVRLIFDEWRKSHCLKTMEDWYHWQDYFLSKTAIKKACKQQNVARSPVQMTKGGSIDMLKRMFMRAYAQQEWGLQRSMTYPKVLEILKSLGCPVSPHDAKNCHKGRLITNSVPRTPETEAVIAGLRLVFEDLDVDKIFIQD